MNLNLSGSLNIFRLLAKPALCLPHATIASFDDLPDPLEKALQAKDKKVDIKAVVLDKDDCFAYPEQNEVFITNKVYFMPCANVFFSSSDPPSPPPSKAHKPIPPP